MTYWKTKTEAIKAIEKHFGLKLKQTKGDKLNRFPGRWQGYVASPTGKRLFGIGLTCYNGDWGWGSTLPLFTVDMLMGNGVILCLSSKPMKGKL